MSVKAPGTNAPLHRKEKEALQRREKLIKNYIDQGMTEEKAKEKAQAEMRDNNQGDWRRG